jgi:hypothetical protein
MSYWLFLVMDRQFRRLWETFVAEGVAAQHNPLGWPNERKNANLLREIQVGDQLVAAIRGHRFVGFGTVTKRFERARRSLGIRRNGDVYEFAERLEVEWHAIPNGAAPPYIECDGRSAGVDTTLNRGACVKPIDSRTFRFIRDRLLKAGVAPLSTREVVHADLEAYKVEEGEEGKKAKRMVNIYERDPRLREQAVRFHGVTCAACGFQFGSNYGERGDGYIEVHHMKPLGSLPGPTMVNPRTDMAVLCANCHRMIHRFPDRPLSIRQLRAVIGKARRSGNRLLQS